MQPVAAAQASLSVLVSFSTTSLSINRTGQLFCKLKEKMKRADLLRGLRVAHGESVPAGLHAAGHRHAQHQVLVTEALRPHVAPVLAPLPGGRHWHRPTCDGQPIIGTMLMQLWRHALQVPFASPRFPHVPCAWHSETAP